MESSTILSIILSGRDDTDTTPTTYQPADPSEERCIVCAWIAWRPTFGGHFIAEPRAVVFLNSGTDADLHRARHYIGTTEGGQVFQFTADDPNPLGSARALMLRQVNAAQALKSELAQLDNTPTA